MFEKVKQKIRNKTSLQISILIIINIIIFLPCIIALPEHYLDDFVVFGVINSHPNNPISLNPADPYFLFLRPVSYLSFWIDYKLFPMMPLLMKFETLLIHLVLVATVYFLLIELKKYFKLEISNGWIFFATMVYSIYPDNYKWITWITNRTELLMILFYVLSLLFMLKYLNNPIHKFNYLLLHLFFFWLSIASKQQALHIPLLFIYLLLIKKRNMIEDQKKIIITLLIIELVVMVIFIFSNFYIHVNESTIFLTNLWKKPLSLFGNLLIILNPYYGEILYTYIVIHKTLAITIVFIFFVVLFLLIYKYRVLKNIILLLISYLIISFPRIFVPAGNRVNSIQVIFVLVILFGCLVNYREKLLRFVLYSLVILNFGTVLRYAKVNNEINTINQFRIQKLISLYDYNTFILVLKDPLLINYQYHFVKTKNYSNANLNIAPILFTELIGPNYLNNCPKITSSILNNRITIETLDEYVFLSINPGESPYYYFNPSKLKVEEAISGRGYSKISFEIPDGMKNKKLIYHDGVDWRVVTQL